MLNWTKSFQGITLSHVVCIFFCSENPTNVMLVEGNVDWENLRKGVPNKEKEVRQFCT